MSEATVIALLTFLTPSLVFTLAAGPIVRAVNSLRTASGLPPRTDKEARRIYLGVLWFSSFLSGCLAYWVISSGILDK